MTYEEMFNRYYLGQLTLGDWWDAMGLEAMAEEKKGLFCVVRPSPDHMIADLDYSTDNFVCCRTQGLKGVTFVHSLDPVAFTVRKSSLVRLEGSLFVEGHAIRFTDFRADPPGRGRICS